MISLGLHSARGQRFAANASASSFVLILLWSWGDSVLGDSFHGCSQVVDERASVGNILPQRTVPALDNSIALVLAIILCMTAFNALLIAVDSEEHYLLRMVLGTAGLFMFIQANHQYRSIFNR